MLRLYLWNFHPSRDDHWIRQLVVDWLNVGVAVSIVEDSHYGRMRASEDFADSSRGAAVSTSGTELDYHVVAVHCRIHVPRRDVDVAFDPVAHRRILWANKAVAIAMNRKLAANQIAIGSSFRQGIAIASHHDQVPALD